MAAALAEEGCDVAISARGEERLSAAVEGLRSQGTKISGGHCDLASKAGCKTFVESAVSEPGGLDILVNNVGGMIPGTLDSLTPADWERVLNVNLMAAVYTTKFAVAHLKKGASARILNVSGVSGKQLLPGSLTTTIEVDGGFNRYM